MKVLENLETLDFKEHEGKVLVELLKTGILSASELAERTKVKRPTVYEILKKFISKGYCNEIETNSITKFQIISPEIITDKIENELNKTFNGQLESIKNVLPELKKIYKSEESEDSKIINVELIRGHNRHRDQKFIELFKQAKEEVLFMVRLEHLVSDELDDIAKKFLKKGGVIKSIYEINNEFRIQKKGNWSKGTTEDLVNACENFEKQGEQVRLSEKQLSNMTIFDRKVVYMNIIDKNVPRHNNSDIIIRNSDSAKNMIDLFSYYWNDSYTINEYKSKLKV